MKKIFKKLFLIGLFSFLFFINNVNAAAYTNFNTNQQMTAINNYLSYNSDKTFNDFVDLLEPYIENLRTELDNQDYIIYLTNYSSSSYPQYFNLYYVYGDFHIASDFTSSNHILRYYKDTSLNYGFYTLNFNSNYSSLSVSSTPSTTDVSFLNFATRNIINGLYLYSNIDTLKYNQYSWSSSSFSINNIGEYTIPSDISISSFKNINYDYEIYDYFNPVEPLNCSKNQVLGFLSNVSDFTFRIKGESNALSEPIRGQLQFNYPSDITITNSDLTIDIVQFNDNEVAGNYKLNCPDNVNACYIEYSYNYIDDITSEVDFGIKVIFNTNNLPRYIQLYNCFHNDMYDYYSSSYTYTNSPDSSSNNDSIISNFLQDGSQPDLDGLVDTSLIGDGPVDSILLLPLNIMNTLLNVLNTNTCRPLVLPLPFVNRNMTLPCISTIYSQINGLDSFLNWFSAIMSAFILYEYFIRLYKWVDDTLTFRENNHFGGF